MKAVLVICEGLHDIIFVQRSLGAVAGGKWYDDPIQDLPSPFGSLPGPSPKGLVAKRIEREVDSLTFRGLPTRRRLTSNPLCLTARRRRYSL